MPETRKQEFVGTIKKCPQCGQVLESFQTRCPACGYEITGVDAANSVKRFFEAYQRETDKARQLELIKNFPVPNTKEDILEFALLASQQVKSFAKSQSSRLNMTTAQYGERGVFGRITGTANKVSREDFYIAWKDKLEQVQLKAEFAFGEDKRGFEQISKIVSDAIAVSEKFEKKKKLMKLIPWGVLLAFVIMTAVLLYSTYATLDATLDSINAKDDAKEAQETTRLESLMTEIQADISSGNYDSAELKLTELHWKYYGSTNQEEWNAKHDILQKRLEEKRKGGK